MKLALWQTVGFPGEVGANLAALERTAQAASAMGATLLLCPECWLCGYNIGSGAADLAETSDGVSAVRIAACAQRHRIAIAYGYAERDRTGGSVFNSVQVIGANGQALAHYRKNHLFGPQERAVYQPGNGFEPPFPFEDFSIGLLICYDVEYPEAVRSLKLMGADLILVPTATTDEYGSVPRYIVPARAIENQLCVAYCNHSGVEHGMRFLGGSCVVGTDGSTIASAGSGDALLIAEIHASAQQACAAIYPYLQDRRPELYAQLVRK
jgi:predicted amidohydrolase